MLFKTDRMAMQVGIEARVPMLDHNVVEKALGLDPELYRNDQHGKLLLRKYLDQNGYELAWRTKTGFNSPVYRDLKKVHGKFVESSIDLIPTEILNRQKLKDEFSRTNGNSINMPFFYAVAMLGQWFKHH